MKFKPETARIYLNTSSSAKSSRKTPKLWNSATHSNLKGNFVCQKESYGPGYTQKKKKKIKWKAKLADLNDKYKKLQK